MRSNVSGHTRIQLNVSPPDGSMLMLLTSFRKCRCQLLSLLHLLHLLRLLRLFDQLRQRFGVLLCIQIPRCSSPRAFNLGLLPRLIISRRALNLSPSSPLNHPLRVRFTASGRIRCTANQWEARQMRASEKAAKKREDPNALGGEARSIKEVCSTG